MSKQVFLWKSFLLILIASCFLLSHAFANSESPCSLSIDNQGLDSVQQVQILTECLESKIDAIHSFSVLLENENQDLRARNEALNQRLNSMRIVFGTTLCKSISFPASYGVELDSDDAIGTPFRQLQPSMTRLDHKNWFTKWDNPETNSASHRSNVDCTYSASEPGYLTKNSMNELSNEVRRYCKDGTLVHAGTVYVVRKTGKYIGRPITDGVAAPIGIGLNFACKQFD